MRAAWCGAAKLGETACGRGVLTPPSAQGITAMSGFADQLATMLAAGGAKGARHKPRLIAASLNWSLRQPADPDAWMPGLLPRCAAAGVASMAWMDFRF